MGIVPISTILTMCSAISIATCFTFFPGNEFGCLHDAFEKFVVEDWKDLSLEHTARPIVGGQPSSIFFKIISLCRSVSDERGLVVKAPGNKLLGNDIC